VGLVIDAHGAHLGRCGDRRSERASERQGGRGGEPEPASPPPGASNGDTFKLWIEHLSRPSLSTSTASLTGVIRTRGVSPGLLDVDCRGGKNVRVDAMPSLSSAEAELDCRWEE
jgi:hypothetical protein